MDESKKQMRVVGIVVLLVLALAVAGFSAWKTLVPHPNVVGTLGMDPQMSEKSNGASSEGNKSNSHKD